MKVDDTSGTMNKRTMEARTYNSELTKTQQLMKGEGQNYRASRAVGGGTGAAGRDFARESQGLGGLVRLYATYAANIYALSAAFDFLRKSAATDTMISAMDQMAGQTGVALGSLAKQFEATTGYAISLRESIEAVSKGASAGLNPKQMLQIAEVAKKASQTLGISMPDAISRLTRGITKLEPELIDELGLFTKLGKSTEEYAAKLGKPVAALTDLQKRQAYANAVISEGLDKYSKINIESNPYDKLAASLSNFGIEAGKVLNTFLKPLADILASSPMALYAAIALLSAKIFKSFIPAISQLKEHFGIKATELSTVTKAKAAEAEKAFKVQQDFRTKNLAKEFENIEELKTAKIVAADAALNVSRRNMTKEAKAITDHKRDIKDITQKDVDTIKALGTSTGGKLGNQYTAWAAAVEDFHSNARKEAEKTAKYEKQLAKPAGMLSPVSITRYDAEKARRAEARQTIISNTAATTSTDGLRVALSKIGPAIQESKLGMLGGIFTGIAAGATAVVTKLGSIIGVLSRAGPYIAAIAGAYTILDMIFATGAKETEYLKGKLDLLYEAGKTAKAVLDTYGESLSVESINAKAKASENLTTSLKEMPQALADQQEALKSWSGFWDKLLPQWLGGQSVKKSATAMSANILKTLSMAVDKTDATEAEDKLKKLFNLDTLTPENLEQAMAEASKSVQQTAIGYSEKISDKIKEINDPLLKAKDGFEVLNKSYLELSNSLNNKDLGSKFATDLIKQVNNLNAAFDNTFSREAELLRLSKNLEDVKVFPAASRDQITKYAIEVGNLTTVLDKAKAEKTKADAAYKTRPTNAGPKMSLDDLKKVEIKLAGARDTANTNFDKANTALVEAMKKNTIDLSGAMSKAIKDLEAPLARAIAQGSIDRQKALLGGLPKTQETVALTTKLELESINIRRQEIIALYENTRAVELGTLSNERDKLEKQKYDVPTMGGARDAWDNSAPGKRLKDVTNQIDEYNRKGPRNPKELEKGMSSGVADIANRNIGLATQLAGITSQQEQTKIKGILEGVSAKSADETKVLQNDLAKLIESNKTVISSDNFKAMSESGRAAKVAEQAAAEKAQQDKIAQQPMKEVQAQAQAVISKAGIDTAVGKLANKASIKAGVDLAAEKVLQESADKRLAIESAINIAAIKNSEIRDKDSVTREREQNTEEQLLNLEKSKFEAANKSLEISIQDNPLRAKEYQDKINANKLESLSRDYRLQELTIEKELQTQNDAYFANLAKNGGISNDTLDNEYKRLQDNIKLKTKGLEDNKKLAENTAKVESDQATRSAKLTEYNAQATIDAGLLEQKSVKDLAALADRESSNNLTKIRLDQAKEVNNITQSDYAIKSHTLELDNIAIDYQKAYIDYQKDKLAKEQDLMRMKIAAGDVETDGYKAAKFNTETLLAIQLKGIEDTEKRRIEVADYNRTQLEEDTIRQKEYYDIVKGGINSLSDAFIEFAKTGKMSFKTLISSMIMELAKLEMNRMMMKLTGGPEGGLFNFIGKVLGVGDTPGPEQLSGPDMPNAKGGVYDQGMRAFAKGSMFTNSIVNTPTKFRFAQGTGLMGEAGPEAIMPLKRGSDGSLGVRSNSSGAKVDIVVNNYSGVKAETKQTVDSRGNRKVEVVIGDMVAQEVSRSGSAMQNSFNSTYGSKPTIPRR